MHVRPDRVQLPQHPVVERRSIDVSERAILRSACEAMTGQPFAAVVALVLAGAGCMVGPNYRRPDVVTPPSWGELAPTAPPAGRSDAVADGSPTAWWTTFDDALLTFSSPMRSSRSPLDGIRSNEPESVPRLGCEGRAMRGRVVTFRPAARIAMRPRRLPSGRMRGVVLRLDERRWRDDPPRRKWF